MRSLGGVRSAAQDANEKRTKRDGAMHGDGAEVVSGQWREWLRRGSQRSMSIGKEGDQGE